MSSEPEVIELDDEVAEIPLATSAVGADVPSPMADLPTGAKFGTLVHAVLETADPFASIWPPSWRRPVRDHSVWWPVDVPADELAAAMVPMHDTPLGPLADGLTLRQIGLQDRMREMDFEFPLAGGDLRAAAPDIRLANVGELLRAHLPNDDPLASYADRLTGAALGRQPLKGYLSGSVDAVLRIGDRYVVVDYKTNWLGDPAAPLTAADYARPRLAEAMLHSDYPLQALLYSVVLHRFLRWRLPRYAPEKHLGGVMYLFLRGMCGPDTPIVDGHPAGVFSWQPPAAADHGVVGSARRRVGRPHDDDGMAPGASARRDYCGLSPTPRCSSRRMSMWRSGLPPWRRSRTRRSRWQWRWCAGIRGTVRCVWTCGQSSSRSVSTDCRGRMSMSGSQ